LIHFKIGEDIHFIRCVLTWIQGYVHEFNDEISMFVRKFGFILNQVNHGISLEEQSSRSTLNIQFAGFVQSNNMFVRQLNEFGSIFCVVMYQEVEDHDIVAIPSSVFIETLLFALIHC
jgi:hypothetical protein